MKTIDDDALTPLEIARICEPLDPCEMRDKDVRRHLANLSSLDGRARLRAALESNALPATVGALSELIWPSVVLEVPVGARSKMAMFWGTRVQAVILRIRNLPASEQVLTPEELDYLCTSRGEVSPSSILERLRPLLSIEEFHAMEAIAPPQRSAIVAKLRALGDAQPLSAEELEQLSAVVESHRQTEAVKPVLDKLRASGCLTSREMARLESLVPGAREPGERLLAIGETPVREGVNHIPLVLPN